MIRFCLTILLSSCCILTTLQNENDYFELNTLPNSLQNLLVNRLSQIQQTPEIQEEITITNATLNNTIMEEFFEELKQHLPDEIGLAGYKFIDDIDFSIKLYLDISGAKIINMTHYNVDKVDINMSTTNDPVFLETWFTFPSWSLVGDYELDVSSPDIHLFGVGPFSIIFNNMKLYTKSYFSVTARDSVNMTEFVIKISIGSSKVNFENLLNDPAAGHAINHLISAAIPRLVQAYEDEIQIYSKQLVIPTANVFFDFFSVTDLILFINYFIS